MEFGGLGGTNSFIKGVAHFRYFYPFLKSQTLGTFVVSQGITYGIGTNLESGTGGELPLYERFFPGGVGGPGDVRGYQLYSLGPQVTILQPERHSAERAGRRRQQGIVAEQRDHVPDLVGPGYSRGGVQRRGAIVPAQGSISISTSCRRRLESAYAGNRHSGRWRWISLFRSTRGRPTRAPCSKSAPARRCSFANRLKRIFRQTSARQAECNWI